MSPNDDILRMYLKEVGKVCLLVAEEEVKLAKRIELGEVAQKKFDQARKKNSLLTLDQRPKLATIINDGYEAKQQLITANLRLVVSIARHYVGKSPDLTLMDLIQEGNIGLFRAVKKFDWRRGCKLATYASWWIRQSIQRALDGQSKVIRIPGHMMKKVSNYQAIRNRLTHELNREPLIEEIASEMRIDVEKVNCIRKIITRIISLEALISEETQKSLYEFVEEDKECSSTAFSDNLSLGDVLHNALRHFSKREREIIKMRFGFEDGVDHTLREVAEHLGVTRERVRQIEKQVLNRLRKNEHICNLE